MVLIRLRYWQMSVCIPGRHSRWVCFLIHYKTRVPIFPINSSRTNIGTSKFFPRVSNKLVLRLSETVAIQLLLYTLLPCYFPDGGVCFFFFWFYEKGKLTWHSHDPSVKSSQPAIQSEKYPAIRRRFTASWSKCSFYPLAFGGLAR